MPYYAECDQCGRRLDADADYAEIDVAIFRDHRKKGPLLVLCADGPRSCYERALASLRKPVMAPVLSIAMSEPRSVRRRDTRATAPSIEPVEPRQEPPVSEQLIVRTLRACLAGLEERSRRFPDLQKTLRGHLSEVDDWMEQECWPKDGPTTWPVFEEISTSIRADADLSDFLASLQGSPRKKLRDRLRAQGITRLAQLEGLDFEELLKIDGFGVTTIRRLRDFLDDRDEARAQSDHSELRLPARETA